MRKKVKRLAHNAKVAAHKPKYKLTEINTLDKNTIEKNCGKKDEDKLGSALEQIHLRLYPSDEGMLCL